MASRRDSDDDDGGLDALLDTMTNVVGILVLVLIVTQMSVADVIDKIMSENKIDATDIREVTQQLIAKQNETDELRKVLIDPLNIDAEKQRAELTKKQELLERRKKLLAEKQKQKNEFAIKIETDRKQAEDNRKTIADTKQRRQELQTLIASSLEKKASLEAMLDQTPKTTVPPADLEVTIPNPRPAPPGSRQALVLCVDNQLYPVNIEAFRKTAELRAKAIIARFNLARDPKAGIDPEKFTPHFERLKDQDDFFDVEYYVADQRFLRLRLIPRDGRGASERELLNPRSRIRTKWLSQLDVKQYYARFHVLPDSYEIYMTARRLFSQAGMLAGWEPQAEDWVLTSWVPGGIELGPPREKKPAPPPAQPAKPANVID
jgi:hypothetical protein